jgi:aldehyde:ferredoxin oxidoreductase
MRAHYGGHVGRTLRVDLTRERVWAEDLDSEAIRKYIGGAGYAARLLYSAVEANTDPFSPRNVIVFAAGPMVGTGFPGATKWTVCAKSPLTYLWGESSASGSFGVELKQAGFDNIVTTGSAASPLMLCIKDGLAELHDGKRLWGKDTVATAKAIQDEWSDSRVRVACIGPAGEQLVRFASIVTDEERVCGRAGMGAVMGSKNLKAIAVRGTEKIPLADAKAFASICEQVRHAVRSPTAPTYTRDRVEGLTADGTARSLESLEKMGGLPVRNWRQGAFPDAIKITGSTLSKTILKGRGMCPQCGIIACWRHVGIDSGRYASVKGHGPEYETCASFGSLCLNSNLESIAKANEICNRLGMDTISTGATIAFAMECCEKGILMEDDLGMSLSWGDDEAIVRMTEMIGRREGVGRLLGEGVRFAAERLGEEAERFAMHVKGMEIPMHDPRRWWTMSLAYATSNRGACHLQGIPAYLEWGLLQPEFGFDTKLQPFNKERMVEATKFHQDFSAAFTAMGHCQFTIGGVIPFMMVADAYSAATGGTVDHWELLKRGERIWNLKRAFNIKMGGTSAEDTLPQRFLEEPVQEGAAAGKVPPLSDLLREYYARRGWEDGKPSRSKLIELEMGDIGVDSFD